VTGIKKLTRSRAAREDAVDSLAELDAALCVNLSEATHKNAKTIREKMALVFIGSAPGSRSISNQAREGMSEHPYFACGTNTPYLDGQQEKSLLQIGHRCTALATKATVN
jgi:hypothetical protein